MFRDNSETLPSPFCNFLSMLMTWRQDKKKPRVPETEGISQEWAVVQAAEFVLRLLVKGGRGCPSVVPKRWPLEQQVPSPENLEPQKSWVSEEGPGPRKLHSKELPLWFWWFFWFGYHWDLWKTERCSKEALPHPTLLPVHLKFYHHDVPHIDICLFLPSFIKMQCPLFMYGWVPSLFTWNHHIFNWLYPKIK